MTKLTDAQRRFCDEYLVDLNGTQAYKRAGYRVKSDIVAANAAKRLLEKPHVRAYIQARQKEFQTKTEISRERVLRELAAVGFSDVTDFVEVNDALEVIIKPTSGPPAGKRAALAGIKQGKFGIEIRLHDKLRALEQISRMMGYLNEDGLAPEGDNGLKRALEQSAGEVFTHEVFEVQQEAVEGADLVGTPGGEYTV